MWREKQEQEQFGGAWAWEEFGSNNGGQASHIS
jgi:hypothetical protein